jgi:hypothetical protein
MMRRSATTLLWLLAGILLAFRLSSPASASCNGFPAGVVRYCGARGTIDRPFVRAGDDVTLTAKPPCGPLPFPTPPARVAVTVVAKSPAQGSWSVDTAASDSELKFRIPKNKLNFAGPVAIAVTSGPPPPDATPLARLAQTRCRDFQRSDLLVCIDQLFTGDCIQTPCGADIHAEFSAVTVLPPQNDFKQMCTRDNGQEPRCSGAPGDRHSVTYTLDASGNVLLNMSWGNILRVKSGNQKDRRQVQGSVIEKALNNIGPSVSIPSEAFLDSFNTSGVRFDPKPLFLPGVPPTLTTPSAPSLTPGQTATPTPKEVGFWGRADENESVLRIARRKLWDHACSAGPNAGQACEQSSDCPGGAACAAISARYFACSQGGLPCTRPRDCPAGTCSQAYCANQSPGQTPTPCATDRDCSGHECGLGLFNLRGNLNNGIGTIPRGKYHGKAGPYE